MLKKLLIFSFLVPLYLLMAEGVYANNLVVSSSANLKRPVKILDLDFDVRVFKLKTFLSKQKSPMEQYAEIIINKADKYRIDWRLLAAISGAESSFGKRMPANSYNAYGWANGSYKFSSWEESFEIVSKTLKEGYIEKGANSLEKIGSIYAPPSKTWTKNVEYFIYQIDSSPVDF